MVSNNVAMPSAVTTATSARPPMTAADETGVARRRLRIPTSRSSGHRDDQVHERGRDDAEGDDSGHVVHRGVDLAARDLDGVALAAEDGGEDHKEEHGQGQREESALAIAEERSEVIAELVKRHGRCGMKVDHRWFLASGGVVRDR